VRCLTTLWLAAVTGVAATAPVVADQAPWLNPEWTVRRVVGAVVQDTGGAGSDVAVCAFYTGGMAKPDASDVRVAVNGRRLTGHRVLQVGPGDLVRVAFEALPNVTRYYVYYGNPKAPAPKPWEIKRGVLLEARRWVSGRRLAGLPMVEAAFAKGRPIGADFVSHISFGHHPFAADGTPTIFHYVGWFIPPSPGTYSIATSSDGGSWILIDGRPVVVWPGSHGAARDARHAKDVALTQAVHRIDYWNVSQAGRTMSVAAWRAPGEKRYRAIPPNVFLPVAEAKLVEVDLRAEKLVADFFAEQADEAWWPKRYAVRMRFTNLSKAVSVAHGGRFEWNFGDGQTSSESRPTHVYLAPGDYTVSLKASRGMLSNTFRTKVGVERDWFNQASREVTPIAQYAEAVAKYDFAKLDVPNLVLAVDLFKHEKMRQPLIAAAKEVTVRREGVSEKDFLAGGLILGENLRAAGRAEEALRAYRTIEGRIKSGRRKAEIAVQIGETLLKDLRRYGEAEKEYQRVLKTYATAGADREIRRAHIGIGDIWRHRGDGEKARAAYTAAAAIRLTFQPPNVAAVRVGTLARNVEEYTRQRQWEWAFKFIDDWAWEFPLDKLKGHWSFLYAQALLARRDRPAALREAMDLLGANPDSAYAVRLLMFAAQCHMAEGQTDKARLLLQTAVEDYPEDPDQTAARARLQALGGRLKTE